MEGAIEAQEQTLRIDAPTEVGLRVAKLNERLARYIPPREAWTPVDEALFGQIDLYRAPLEEARAMQLKAITYAFTRHYNNNSFYHEYCTTRGVSPSDIKTVDDLFKIPLIPDLTFKQYPEGKDFARWIGSVFTGDLPKVVIKGSNPTFDEVINAFNASGMAVTYSSGTSGRFTFIPRDQKTFSAGQYGLAKSVINMWAGDLFKTDGYLLLPNPEKTNVFVGKVTSVYFDMVNDVQMAIDRELTTKDIQTAMSGGGWKVRENIRLPVKDFRRQVYDVLGIPEASCLDLYGMVEGNGWMVQCPEGHYLHLPYTYYKPFVLDEDLMPTGYGESGRFAYLDALAESYPGFIITGDQVRMYEHCPVCNRPGPVLEPEIHRAKGEEVRGCAEEVRRALTRNFSVD